MEWSGTKWNINFTPLFGYFMKCFYFISYTPNWRGRKMRENDGMR
jgi:hypothetical protein